MSLDDADTAPKDELSAVLARLQVQRATARAMVRDIAAKLQEVNQP